MSGSSEPGNSISRGGEAPDARPALPIVEHGAIEPCGLVALAPSGGSWLTAVGVGRRTSPPLLRVDVGGQPPKDRKVALAHQPVLLGRRARSGESPPTACRAASATASRAPRLNVS